MSRARQYPDYTYYDNYPNYPSYTQSSNYLNYPNYSHHTPQPNYQHTPYEPEPTINLTIASSPRTFTAAGTMLSIVYEVTTNSSANSHQHSRTFSDGLLLKTVGFPDYHNAYVYLVPGASYSILCNYTVTDADVTTDSKVFIGQLFIYADHQYIPISKMVSLTVAGEVVSGEGGEDEEGENTEGLVFNMPGNSGDDGEETELLLNPPIEPEPEPEPSTLLLTVDPLISKFTTAMNNGVVFNGYALYVHATPSVLVDNYTYTLNANNGLIALNETTKFSVLPSAVPRSWSDTEFNNGLMTATDSSSYAPDATVDAMCYPLTVSPSSSSASSLPNSVNYTLSLTSTYIFNIPGSTASPSSPSSLPPTATVSGFLAIKPAVSMSNVRFIYNNLTGKVSINYNVTSTTNLSNMCVKFTPLSGSVIIPDPSTSITSAALPSVVSSVYTSRGSVFTTLNDMVAGTTYAVTVDGLNRKNEAIKTSATFMVSSIGVVLANGIVNSAFDVIDFNISSVG